MSTIQALMIYQLSFEEGGGRGEGFACTTGPTAVTRSSAGFAGKWLAGVG